MIDSSKEYIAYGNTSNLETLFALCHCDRHEFLVIVHGQRLRQQVLARLRRAKLGNADDRTNKNKNPRLHLKKDGLTLFFALSRITRQFCSIDDFSLKSHLNSQSSVKDNSSGPTRTN